MRARRTALLLALLVTSPALAGDGPRFRFSKDVGRGADARDEILSVSLDSDVYAATREGYPDLRLLDRENGAEVPYALERIEERRRRHERRACSAEVASLREVGEQALEIVVRLADDAPAADGLTVVSPLVDYEHRVKVLGSADGKEWTPLVSDALIFDYSRYMDVRNREIPLPANSSRQFKLVVERVADRRESPLRLMTRSRRGDREVRDAETTAVERRPFRIDRIEAWRLVDVEGNRRPVTVNYPVAGFAVENDREARVTRIEVRTRREPLTSLAVETASRNFLRTATVRAPETREGKEVWVEIGRGTLERLDLQGFRRERLKVDFPERRDARYEIVIENGDSPPLEITGIKAQGTSYRLVFLGSPGRAHRLAYGSADAGPPSYDTAAVLASLRTGYRPASLPLGDQVEDPNYKAQPQSRGLLGRPVVLVLALILMVVVLAWVLFRAGKRIQKLPEDEV